MSRSRTAGRLRRRRFRQAISATPDTGARVEMTARIREFLKHRKVEGPCLVVDLDVVRDNFVAFAKCLPDTKVYYAVKANPAPEILKVLGPLGSGFNVSSV